jgi:hypothetical protein
MDVKLLNLDDILRRIGRGVIYFATATAADSDRDPILWDRTTDLYLKQLGDTEGDIQLVPNGEVANLTLPEISGGAPLEATHLGEAPALEFPLFLADPDLLPIISPRGTAHAGFQRVCDVTDITLVVFPETLFREADCTFGTLSYTTAGGWKLDGVALTPAQLTKLEVTLWLWRGYFERPTLMFRGGHGDEGKNIEAVRFVSLMNTAMPNGHLLWTRGDPNTYGISLEGAS